MKTKFMNGKRMMAFLLGITVCTTSIPAITPAAEAAKTLKIGESIKFDFGGAGNVANGYIGVNATKTYFTEGVEALNTDSTTGYTYGFLGIGEDGYLASDRADGDRTDGFTMDPGMEITLLEGGNGTDVASDYVYASQTIYNLEKTDKEEAYDMGDGTMPIRFALNVEPTSFYTVKATLANASTTEKAVVNLYTERRHQIATNVELAAGETKEITFNAAVTDVYFQKSEPKGTYTDSQLNVTVTGTNAALAELEVTRIEHQPTMYICADSTGCDQVGYVPSYPLHNYTGVGQGLRPYFKDVMVSNQGEGGLAAGDSLHFNSAAAQIQAGDYLYVQYGHNHKNDGVAGYVNCLKKYYQKAHEKGATLLLVGPIDRQTKNQYNSSTNTWSSTLSGYSKAAEGYVTALIYGGLTAADAYAVAWQTSESAADTYLEGVVAGGITNAGVTDAAFIDLNAGWLEFLTGVTAGNATIGQNAYAHASFYYTYNNVYDAKDLTHINDYGASQAGYIFATEVKEAYEAGIAAGEGTSAYIQAKALETLYKDYTTNRAEVLPDTVSDETVLAGAAPNSRYPQKFVVEETSPYTTAIDKIGIKNGTFATVDVNIVSGMNSYGRVALKVYDGENNLLGTIWTTDWLDNTSMTAGSKATLHFEESDIKVPSNGKCVAAVYPVSADTQEYDGSADAVSLEYTAQLSNGNISVELAFGKPVTASGDNNGKNPASNIVDGNETTVWSPGSGATANFVVDLGTVYAIDKVVLYTYDWYGFPYTIELSENGTDYEVFYEQTTASGKDYTTEEADPEEVGYGRYVKVTASKPDSRNWIGLADLKVYAYVEKEETVVDKTELDKAITEAVALVEADYTKESWATLQTALTEAKTVVADEKATEDMVTTALTQLQAAVKALAKAPVIQEQPSKEDEIKLATVKITQAKNNKKRAVQLKWKKVENASGYEIHMSQKKTKGYKKIGTIKKAKTVTFTKKKLKKGKKYYFKVKAYATVNGKTVYGEFSKPKMVKVKK